MSKIKIAVTGGRLMFDVDLVKKVLGKLLGENIVLAHGGAAGADTLCGNYAEKAGWKVIVYKAEWDRFGKRAGTIRNAKILDDFKPDLLIAFPGGRGTFNMINLAIDRKIKIIYSGAA